MSGWDAVPKIYKLQGVYDVDGDGVMEIIIHTDALPEIWNGIYKINGEAVQLLATANKSI